ncbi:P-selectin [Pholidichthys leucotaenia]
MESYFKLIQTWENKQSASWTGLIFLVLCTWTSADCWSYHYSNHTMKWEEARAWCRSHYTDMVAIQNQEEIQYLNNLLPKKDGYYWIGIRKVDNVWTWVGTNKVLTEEATNWARGEPNNGRKKGKKQLREDEDCVEMYIKRDSDPGKWNDERCTKLKTALCYTAACQNDSCIHGECVETINSHKCECFEGFYGDKCEHVVQCDKEEVTVPNKGRVDCTHKHGDFSYDTVCQYSCEEGYELSMAEPLRCTASKQWSEQPPTCDLVQCDGLFNPAQGSMECSDPLGAFSYQSTCVFTCNKGYVLADSLSNTLQCEASGRWNVSKPSCVVVQCEPLQHPENGIVSCDTDMRFSYDNTCNFSCVSGYHLVGPSSVTCTSAGEWSEKVPRCEAITCQIPEAASHLNTQCSDPLNELWPNSSCSFSCEPGFELLGAPTTKCSDDGRWNEAVPTCKAKECPAPEVPESGQISCNPSVSFETYYPVGSVCSFSCDESHELQGELTIKCMHLGQWTSKPPTCTAVRCPLLEAPENGRINCSNSEPVYNSQCSFNCNQDYTIEGHELLTCDRNGNWTGEKPTCQAPATVTAITTGVVTGGTALLSGLSAALWILKKLREKASKFELNSNSDIEDPPQTYKSSSAMTRMSFDTRQRLSYTMLLTALIVSVQDLNSRGRAQAWTYNYSTGPNLRWLQARQWCQKYFTDMVAIQNQEETEFLNSLLPFNPNYYWIGVQNVTGVWTWVQTNKNVPEQAQNWATAEPDNIPGQDCVEIYIKRKTDAGKWNNEKCRARKGTVCYTASCKQESCSAHADCVETTGNYSCKCHPGFQGPRCEDAIACKPLPHLEQGSHNCFHPYGPSHFNSSCQFQCELGFRLVGVSQLICQESGDWNRPVPLCQAEECPVLNQTNFSGGIMRCSHPIKPFSYNSTCEFRCDEGYELNGQNLIKCDHTGQWTANPPTCTVKKCSSIFSPVTGNMTCVDPVELFSFGSQCNFTCQEGYDLTGNATLTCLASGQWSNPTPTCTVVQCNSLKTPLHGFMQCRDPIGEHSYSSICSVHCEEGFDLIGTDVIQCSAQGNWSHALPICQAKSCSQIISPLHGSLYCYDPNGPYSFGSSCTHTCDEGFVLNGTSKTECTSLGRWTADTPHCFARSCPILIAPPHGSLFCSDPHGEFSFDSQCKTTCEIGFVLNGTAETQCTSSGTWSEDFPQCLAKRCPPLISPPHGSVFCSDPHGEFRFGSQCRTSCDEGFVLNGNADTECTSQGMWNAEIPKCLARRCPILNSTSHGSLVCSDPNRRFSFGSQCISACEEGFLLNGTASTECTSMGRWTSKIPRCQARHCPLLASSPQHGRMNCSHPNSPFSYDSRCDFECSEGFWLRGAPTMRCNTSGHWDQDLPSCQPIQCEAIGDLSSALFMNCSHLLGNFSFASQCLFSCEEGFSLNGTEMLLCSSAGVWSDNLPSCTGLPGGTPMLLHSSAGTASVVVISVILVIGLALMVTKQFRRRGGSEVSDVPPFGERENPAFEF